MNLCVRITVMLIAAICLACSSIDNKTLEGSPDVSLAVGERAIVFNSFFTDPVGSLSVVNLDGNFIVEPALVTSDGSDAVIRLYGNKIYVINRFGTDTIQVVDANNFSVTADYSVGSGSNPQDIVVASDAKAYVSRLDSQNDSTDDSDVLIINPQSGERLGGIDLKPYTTDDEDRLARAAQMVLVGDMLYVCIEDLPKFMGDPADTNGKVAIIDVKTDDVTGVIQLEGRNPSDIAYVEESDELVVADTGVYHDFVVDTSDPYGGIEFISRTVNESLGILIDDADFGGGVTEVRVLSNKLAFTIINSSSIGSFDPAVRQVVNKEVYISAGSYLPDIALDSNGRLLIAEQDFHNPGVVVLNSADGSVVSTAIGVGALPVSIAVIND